MQKRALTALVTVLALVLLYLPEPGAAAGTEAGHDRVAGENARLQRLEQPILE